MDKQMIEEMAKAVEPIIKDFYVTCTNGECDACIVKRWTGKCHAETKSVRVAECFYNAGYRKIPEGSVVLDKDEYDGKSIIVEMSGGHKLKLSVGKFGEMSKILEEHTRKETAEKFAERLKEMAYQSTDWSHGTHPMVVEVDDIDEICEEISEEQ